MLTVPTYTYRQPGITPADLVRLALLGSPIAVLFLLLWNPHLDPQLQAPGLHFVIVTLAAGMAALVGLLVLLVAERLRETRAFALGLAFCAIAGFFFIHGLLTPGFVVKKTSKPSARCDGSGYPDGIAGDAVPLEARVLAVADVLDAMRSGRSYRPALAGHVALVYLVEHAGRLFDPYCVEAMREIAEGQDVRSAQPGIEHLTQPVADQI